MRKNEAVISKMPDYLSTDRSSEARPGAKRNAPGQAQGQSGPVYKVRAPTGQIVLVPESDLDEAISRGGVVEP